MSLEVWENKYKFVIYIISNSLVSVRKLSILRQKRKTSTKFVRLSVHNLQFMSRTSDELSYDHIFYCPLGPSRCKLSASFSAPVCRDEHFCANILEALHLMNFTDLILMTFGARHI